MPSGRFCASRRHSHPARLARPARLMPRASPSVPLPEGVGGASGATGASPVTGRMRNRWRPPLAAGEGPGERAVTAEGPA